MKFKIYMIPIVSIVISTAWLFACAAMQVREASEKDACSTGKLAMYHEDFSGKGYVVASRSAEITYRIPTDEMKFSPYFRFSLDGQSIIVSGNDKKFDPSAQGWYSVDIASGTWNLLFPVPIEHGQPGIFIFAPKKNMIALSISKSDNFVHFYTAASDLQNIQDMNKRSEDFESPYDWSSDAQFILYNSYSADEKKDSLIIRNLSDGTYRILYSSTEQLYARWSPDNEYLIVEERHPQSYLFLLNVKTANKTELHDIPRDSLSPAWSNDGKCIAFLHDDGVYIYNLAANQTIELKDLAIKNGYRSLDWGK